MALKPDRVEDPYGQDVEWYFETTCERGGIATIDTAKTGVGGYPGDRNKVAKYAASPANAVPLGMMLYDVVDYDVNRQHENFYKSGFQARVNQKVVVDRSGRYTTNMIPSGVTPAPGNDAYVAASGMFSNVQASGAARVGTWLSAPDADGYAKIQMELR